MIQAIKQAVIGKQRKDIVIVGKGPSIDKIDLSLLSDCIVINTNDSELIYPGDIAVFHNGWVLDTFDHHAPRCSLYISDRHMSPSIPQLQVEYVPYTPESADFMINRFFSDTLYIEHPMIVSALRIANEIAKAEGLQKNVYLIGFDFTTKDGYTSQIPAAASHDEAAYSERVVAAQEQLLTMLLNEKDRLSINVHHVGDKQYSIYSTEAFNQVFATRCGSTMEVPLGTESTIESFKVKVVAEITTNHFGDMDRLKSMILTAKKAGANYIKLQKRDVESFYNEEQLSAPYTSPFGSTFRDYRHGIELSKEDFEFVDVFCKDVGIGWFVSILDQSSYEFIRQFNPELIKLPSTISEHTNFLKAVANDFENDVVISTGYTKPEYEDFILNTFTKARNLYLLQCTSAYPTQNEDTQVGVIRHYYNLSKKYPNVIPGFSSHDIGSLCSMLSVAAGARMIEKHVKFGDVAWSHFDEVAVDLVNGDFSRLVEDIRSAERIVGEEVKVVQSSEHHKYWLENSVN